MAKVANKKNLKIDYLNVMYILFLKWTLLLDTIAQCKQTTPQS